jgi:SUMO ligase MMS21 Smc5/6 complex component
VLRTKKHTQSHSIKRLYINIKKYESVNNCFFLVLLKFELRECFFVFPFNIILFSKAIFVF